MKRPAALVFLLTFLYHATSPVAQQGDSRWTVYTAISLLREGNLDLNEYPRQIEASGFYAIECVTGNQRRYPIQSLAECPGGRLYHFYPVSISLLALPLIAVQLGVLQLLPALPVAHPVLKAYLQADPTTGSPIFEIVAASFFAALATLLLYAAARRHLTPRAALFAAFLFAACTPMLSTASRALWQHGILAMLLSAMLLVLPRPAVGPILALAFFVRPTAVVPIAVAGVYMMRRRHRTEAVKAILYATPVVAFFVALNYHMYGMPLAPYFFPVRPGSTSLALHSRYVEALAGTLLSPARGLLIYMPFLLLLPLRANRRVNPPLAPWIAAMIAAHWLLICLHTDWWGGYAFGPRYFTDVTPLLIYLLLPVIARPNKAFLALVLAAFLIHFQGSHRTATQLWNVTPIDVNADTSRLWDWSDPPFLR